MLSFKRLHFRFVECTVYKLNKVVNFQLLIFKLKIGHLFCRLKKKSFITL